MNYATIKEWAWCLLSPSHASTTSLRIPEHTEEVALKLMAGVVITIFLAVSFVAGVTWQRYQNLLQLRKEYRTMQVQAVPAENVRFL